MNYTDDYLESKLREYLLQVRPQRVSWGNTEHVHALIQWIETNNSKGESK